MTIFSLLHCKTQKDSSIKMAQFSSKTIREFVFCKWNPLKGSQSEGPCQRKLKLRKSLLKQMFYEMSLVNWFVLKLLFIPLCPLREVHKTQMSPYVSIMISLESAKGGLRILVRCPHTLPLLFTMITLHIMGFSSFML